MNNYWDNKKWEAKWIVLNSIAGTRLAIHDEILKEIDGTSFVRIFTTENNELLVENSCTGVVYSVKGAEITKTYVNNNKTITENVMESFSLRLEEFMNDNPELFRSICIKYKSDIEELESAVKNKSLYPDDIANKYTKIYKQIAKEFSTELSLKIKHLFSEREIPLNAESLKIIQNLVEQNEIQL